ncbi:MAG TPA: response regulator [Candidatus Dormibacteraeota bacterium]|nr:response regulator [Candidatus Dormibacteraeota bacterium]
MPTAIVIDDTAADRLLAETLLKHAGYTVTTCVDGLLGLALIREKLPDLIVADLITPGIDGYDLARAVRGDARTATTPMVLQTAHYLEADVRRLASQIGVTSVIIKPYEPQAFLDTVAAASRHNRAVNPTGNGHAAGDFHAEHLRLVSAKLHEKVRELETARGEFETTAARYRNLFRVHPEPMWVFNIDTLRFLEVNDAAVLRYGYSHDEFLAMTIAEIYPPEELPAILAATREPAALNSISGVHVVKGGAQIEVQVSTRDVGKGSRYVMAQDVTEKKKYQQHLAQAQRMESLGQLAGGVAHDFNNLLGVIINFSWFVKANLTAEIESGNGERLRPVLKDMERIERAAENAARLTQQLLAFARVDVAQPRPMDLNVVVAELAPLLRRTIGEHIELLAEPGTALWPVMIDSGQVSQVLTNLAVNSRDAMPKGGKLTIDVENVDVDVAYVAAHMTLKPGRYVRLRVSDTGAGMDKQTLEHAFEPFFTTKPRGQGTGLGLATIYGIVTQAGGSIEVYSEPGLGTRVSVLLPATDQAVTADDVTLDAPVSRAVETVLVVEDSDDLREVVDRILTKSGYQVIVATGGAEALEASRKFTGHIDLLLTDVVMPHMLGNELAPQLIEARPDLRVLYMSGFAQPALAANGKLQPGVTLLDKPFNEPTLLARVREVLEAVK